MAQGTVTCGLNGKKQVLAINLFGTLTASGDPAAIVGQLTLDGKGNLSGLETVSIDFSNSSLQVTGTYTQNADCTGTMQMAAKGFSAANFNTVAVNAGKELLLIETDANTLVGGNAQQ